MNFLRQNDLNAEKPIIVTYLIWIFMDAFIIIGAIIYG